LYLPFLLVQLTGQGIGKHVDWRHVNYFDGSYCVYEIIAGTVGGPMQRQRDGRRLYSVGGGAVIITQWCLQRTAFWEAESVK
jgi:hypothetical protein